jgi:N6-L-threonylcarbamoyladenine synthase
MMYPGLTYIMRILGIETSCDDTGVSIIEATGKPWPKFRNVQNQRFLRCRNVSASRRITFRILANVIASQIEIHQKYGGVYPNMAKREHETNLPIAVAQALKKAKMTPKSLDALAVTYGPGLSPCLWTGINEVQKLAKQWSIPIIPTNHMEGHLSISLFSQRSSVSKFQVPSSKQTFPAIALLVSGGHTQLILVTALGKYKLLGETRDDAAGECFDKTARILGLPYPGGPAVAAQAALAGKPTFSIKLPRPMISTKDYDLSFSGLKTAVLYDWKSRSKKVQKSTVYVREMAKEIQDAIVQVLCAKTLRAAQRSSAKAIILGGGVGANTILRNTLCKEAEAMGMKFLAAPKELCTDNGAMIAVAGYATWLRSGFKKYRYIEANPNLTL